MEYQSRQTGNNNNTGAGSGGGFLNQHHPMNALSQSMPTHLTSSTDRQMRWESDHLDDLEDTSARMVDWVVGSSSPPPPSDDEDEMDRLSGSFGIPIRTSHGAGGIGGMESFQYRHNSNTMATSPQGGNRPMFPVGSPLDPKAATFTPGQGGQGGQLGGGGGGQGGNNWSSAEAQQRALYLKAAASGMDMHGLNPGMLSRSLHGSNQTSSLLTGNNSPAGSGLRNRSSVPTFAFTDTDEHRDIFNNMNLSSSQQQQLAMWSRSRSGSNQMHRNNSNNVDFDPDDLQFELSDVDAVDPSSFGIGGWGSSSGGGHHTNLTGGMGSSSTSSSSAGNGRTSAPTSALSAGLAAHGVGRSLINQHQSAAPPRFSPSNGLDIDEGTPTAFSVAMASSLRSVPELALPTSFSDAAGGRRNNMTGQSQSLHLSGMSNQFNNGGTGNSEGSAPIAIVDRHGSFKSQNNLGVSSSWNSSYSFGGPSSLSSDEGGFLSGSYGGPGGMGSGSGTGGGGGGGFGKMSSSVGGSMMSGSVGGVGGGHGKKERVVKQLPPGRSSSAASAPAVSELGDDECPILKVPRNPFWNQEGTMEIPNREWKKGGTEKADNRHFMVMSYNVLAPMYCTENRYHQSETQHLDWDYRKRRILDEIAYYAPDFVCLQELPPSEFKELFLPELQKIGYDGHFQQKKKSHAADGSATFYIEARFSLLAVQAFAYNDQIPQDPSSDLYQRLNPFPNVALVCVFQNRQARSLRVRVVNTHLHWDPAYADTKLLQAAILMEWLERTHRDVPTVIAADLNSRAGEAVVDFLVRGKVAPGPLFGDRDFGRFTASLTLSTRGVPPIAAPLPGSFPNQDQLMMANAAGKAGLVVGSMPTGGSTGLMQPLPLLRHGTKLASAYDRKDLPFTNKTPEFEGCIDHILYTSGTLSIRDVLGDFDGSLSNSAEKSEQGDGAAGKRESDEVGVNGPRKKDKEEKEKDKDTSEPSSDISPTSSLTPTADANDLSDTPVDDVRVGSNIKEEAEDKDDLDETSKLLLQVELSDQDPGTSGDEAQSGADEAPNATTPTAKSGNAAAAGPVPPVAQGYLAKIKSLPTKYVPSDHLPLCAWLKWKTVPVGTGPISLGTNGMADRARTRGGRRGGGGGGSGNGSGTPNGMSPMGAGLSMNPGQNISLLSSSAPVRISPLMNGGALSGGGGGGNANLGYDRPPLPLSIMQQMQQQSLLQQIVATGGTGSGSLAATTTSSVLSSSLANASNASGMRVGSVGSSGIGIAIGRGNVSTTSGMGPPGLGGAGSPGAVNYANALRNMGTGQKPL
ncbi:Glucose-repressible alcohol dehydrogenase transcriptional effector [Blyttiomyces sp. JEL0837]|nr:Glucose-repressible alcohol dehydrogenase transcriptional effector [Blyttiomyces sp. JEL0837]